MKVIKFFILFIKSDIFINLLKKIVYLLNYFIKEFKNIYYYY